MTVTYHNLPAISLCNAMASPYRDNVLKSQCSVEIRNFMNYRESDLWKVMKRMLSLAIFAVRVLEGKNSKKCLHFCFRKLKKKKIYNFFFLVMSLHKNHCKIKSILIGRQLNSD